MYRQVLGRQGVKLQIKAGNADNSLDFLKNNQIEQFWKKWGRRAGSVYPGCDTSGKFTFLDFQHQVLDTVLRDGEALVYLQDVAAEKETDMETLFAPINSQKI